MVENEVFKFEEQICDFEEDLANDGTIIPEDIRDGILAAIGKAKLLISQKFVQFRGLCDKNIVRRFLFKSLFLANTKHFDLLLICPPYAISPIRYCSKRVSIFFVFRFKILKLDVKKNLIKRLLKPT